MKTKDGMRKCGLCEEIKPVSEFTKNSRSGYLHSYCKPCATKKGRREKQKFKKDCVAYKGGKCIRCGYNKCPAALEFHHRNPEEKEFSLRDVGGTIALTDRVKAELDKCDLLCSNCHKEEHYSEH